MRWKILLFSFILLCVNLNSIVLVDYIQMHGFVSQGFYKSNENNIYGRSKDGSFQFNEIGMNFTADFYTNLRAGLQFMYRDLTENNAKVGIDWAYGDLSFKDWLGLRSGIIKIPFGFYNEIRDIDKLRTFIFLPQSVYNENWRDSFKSIEGLSLYGNFSTIIGDLSYQFLGGLIKIPKNGRLAKESAFGIININEVKEKNSYVANIQWTPPIENFGLNFSWMNMDFDIYGTNNFMPNEAINPVWDTDIFTFSAKYEPGKFTIVSELTNYDLNVSNFEFTNPATNNKITFEPFTSLGYYGAISYQIFDFMEIGTYYSEFYFDKDDKDGEKFAQMGQPNFRAFSKDLDFTINIDYKKNFSFKIEAHKIKGVAGTFPDENTNYKENWYLFSLKLSYHL
jgi:hypothetical protein